MLDVNWFTPAAKEHEDYITDNLLAKWCPCAIMNIFVDHLGSALTVSSSNVQILRTLFNSNLGGSLQQCSLPRDLFYTMAGAALVSKQSSVVISECVFQGNTAAEVGGAVFAELHSKILILNTVFERNNAACTTKCVGGALYSIRIVFYPYTTARSITTN